MLAIVINLLQWEGGCSVETEAKGENLSRLAVVISYALGKLLLGH